MNPALAQRQAETAARRRPDGTRGAAAQGAWQRLLRGRDKGDFTAAVALLDAFALDPDDDRWEDLQQHFKPEWLFDRAVKPDRPAGQRAAIGAFCVRRGLAPDGERARALFLVMTGQRNQHRALDPDGSLLAAAYQAADPATRAALREMLAGAGDQELIRVIAGPDRPGQGARVSTDETRYLVSQLSERGEWPQLWQLVQDLPLASAIAVMPRLRGWRPADDSGRALFELLARAGSGELARARDALAVPEVVRIDLEEGASAASFSPDGRLLAVCVQDWIDATPLSPGVDLVSDLSLRVYRLPGGELAERHDGGRGARVRLLHLGDALLVARKTERDVRGQYSLLMFSGGRQRTLYSRLTAMTVEPHECGFVALEAGYGSCRLRFHATSGRVVRSVWPFRMGVQRGSYPPQLLASDPGTGRLAIDCDGLWILDRDATSVLARPSEQARERDRGVREASFAGPDRLVTADGGHVRLLRLADGGLETEASAGLTRKMFFDHPLAVTGRGEIAILDDDQLRYLDPQTLSDVPASRDLAGAPATGLWSSPDRRLLAVGGTDHVQVVAGAEAPVAGLAGRSLASLTPADLGVVTASLRGAAAGPERSFLELLREVLQRRFGAEVEIGGAPGSAAGPDEAGLAGDGDGSP
jgi:hypothetical protein